MNPICIIPARGGSKGIPNKNIIDFNNHPLLSYSITQALSSSFIQEVYVSSDSDQILDIAQQYGAFPIVRPLNISGDKASSEEALTHTINQISTPFDTVVFLQPTSPLRTSFDIDKCLSDFYSKKLDSLFSSCELEDCLIWEDSNGNLSSINYNFNNRKRRQDHLPQLVENGSIYIFNKKGYIQNKNRLFGKIGHTIMESWKMFEIDNFEDLELCSFLYKKNLK
jgi:CMP-N,N'-diacetyllegionaminic acid synthase